MSYEMLTETILSASNPTESRCLTIYNLPKTATEQTIKEYFER